LVSELHPSGVETTNLTAKGPGLAGVIKEGISFSSIAPFILHHDLAIVERPEVTEDVFTIVRGVCFSQMIDGYVNVATGLGTTITVTDFSDEQVAKFEAFSLTIKLPDFV
jgi:hypothetical protein